MRRGAGGGGVGRETGEEGACGEGREVGRREGEGRRGVEVGTGGYMYEGRGGREGRVMKRYPARDIPCGCP